MSRIPLVVATTVRIFPPQTYSYEEHKLFVKQTYASFRVRACQDAHIVVSYLDDATEW